jgi:glutamate dehydrogenase
MENFVNGVTTYSIFFPSAKEEEMRQLERTLMYSTLLKAIPGRSGTIYDSVMDNRLTHEVGLYVLAAVKFAYYYFPKEQYAPGYLSLHQVLDRDERSQHKLERLYHLCLKELLKPERIYMLVQDHLDLMIPFFEDFRAIAVGDKTSKSNEELEALIDRACPASQDQQILRMFLTFNESIRLTNFFQTETPVAMAFRLDPSVVLRGRPSSIYPVTPHAIYMIVGRDFAGFHVRFKDVPEVAFGWSCPVTEQRTS